MFYLFEEFILLIMSLIAVEVTVLFTTSTAMCCGLSRGIYIALLEGLRFTLDEFFCRTLSI